MFPVGSKRILFKSLSPAPSKGIAKERPSKWVYLHGRMAYFLSSQVGQDSLHYLSGHLNQHFGKHSVNGKIHICYSPETPGIHILVSRSQFPVVMVPPGTLPGSAPVSREESDLFHMIDDKEVLFGLCWWLGDINPVLF